MSRSNESTIRVNYHLQCGLKSDDSGLFLSSQWPRKHFLERQYLTAPLVISVRRCCLTLNRSIIDLGMKSPNPPELIHHHSGGINQPPVEWGWGTESRPRRGSGMTTNSNDIIPDNHS